MNWITVHYCGPSPVGHSAWSSGLERVKEENFYDWIKDKMNLGPILITSITFPPGKVVAELYDEKGREYAGKCIAGYPLYRGKPCDECGATGNGDSCGRICHETHI